MMLEQWLLRRSPEAVNKYKDRDVKIFCPIKQIWLCCNHQYACKKSDACVFTVQEALELSKDFSGEQKVEFHFVDSIGEDKPGIQDYDDEHIYDCVTVKFDKFRSTTQFI